MTQDPPLQAARSHPPKAGEQNLPVSLEKCDDAAWPRCIAPDARVPNLFALLKALRSRSPKGSSGHWGGLPSPL
jgi:hypothetical protein